MFFRIWEVILLLVVLGVAFGVNSSGHHLIALIFMLAVLIPMWIMGIEPRKK